jgi:hypothetical protein
LTYSKANLSDNQKHLKMEQVVPEVIWFHHEKCQAGGQELNNVGQVDGPAHF